MKIDSLSEIFERVVPEKVIAAHVADENIEAFHQLVSEPDKLKAALFAVNVRNHSYHPSTKEGSAYDEYNRSLLKFLKALSNSGEKGISALADAFAVDGVIAGLTTNRGDVNPRIPVSKLVGIVSNFSPDQFKKMGLAKHAAATLISMDLRPPTYLPLKLIENFSPEQKIALLSERSNDLIYDAYDSGENYSIALRITNGEHSGGYDTSILIKIMEGFSVEQRLSILSLRGVTYSMTQTTEGLNFVIATISSLPTEEDQVRALLNDTEYDNPVLWDISEGLARILYYYQHASLDRDKVNAEYGAIKVNLNAFKEMVNSFNTENIEKIRDSLANLVKKSSSISSVLVTQRTEFVEKIGVRFSTHGL